MTAVAVSAICINWDQLRLKNHGIRVYYLQYQGKVSLYTILSNTVRAFAMSVLDQY